MTIEEVLELAHGTYSMRDDLANQFLIIQDQRDKLLKSLDTIAMFCGTPDAAHGCRNILELIKEIKAGK